MGPFSSGSPARVPRVVASNTVWLARAGSRSRRGRETQRGTAVLRSWPSLARADRPGQRTWFPFLSHPNAMHALIFACCGLCACHARLISCDATSVHAWDISRQGRSCRSLGSACSCRPCIAAVAVYTHRHEHNPLHPRTRLARSRSTVIHFLGNLPASIRARESCPLRVHTDSSRPL